MDPRLMLPSQVQAGLITLPSTGSEGVLYGANCGS